MMLGQIEIAIRAVEAAKQEISEIKNRVPPGYPKIGKIEDAELGADWVIKHLEDLRKDAMKSQAQDSG